jgi:Ca2+-binding EF-hand superfamily protein
MKTKPFIIIAASIGIIGSAYAEEGKPERQHRKLPPEILKKFDKDGDGKLNEEEREAAKAAREEMMKARKKEMLEKFDKDGDGKLSEEEEKAAREAMRKRMLEKFDKDGDGELSEAERAEMRKEMGDRPGGPRRPDGKRKPGDGERKRPQAHGDKEAPGAGE